jgi:hypothetical protein
MNSANVNDDLQKNGEAVEKSNQTEEFFGEIAPPENQHREPHPPLMLKPRRSMRVSQSEE